MSANPCKTILQFIAKDLVEPAMLAQNDYLRAENQILRSQVKKLNLNNGQRYPLAKLGRLLKAHNKIFLKLPFRFWIIFGSDVQLYHARKSRKEEDTLYES